MISLKAICYDIWNLARGGEPTDDDSMSIRQIAFWVHNTRALLIRQDLDKRRSVSANIRQSLGCVEVALVDVSSCCNISTLCYGLRTVEKIPNPIELEDTDMITFVGPVDSSLPPFQLIPYHRARVIIASGKKTRYPIAFLHDGYIFVIGDNIDSLKMINVQGVFDNPSEVAKFKTCAGEVCFKDDGPYPISQWMVEPLKQTIMSNNIKFLIGSPNDDVNDADNNVSPDKTTPKA